MVTTEHVKIQTTGNKLRNYISYFQSVTTIGIINRAKDSSEAELKARKKLHNSDFMCGVVGQSPFELHATDEWQSSLQIGDVGETLTEETAIPIKGDPIILNLSESDKHGIANKFDKDFSTLNNNDYVDLLKTMIEMALE